MTLVCDIARPHGALGQTHVLLVGVSNYPWLEDGAQARGPEVTDGMGQLYSPALSARAIADWFLTEFRNDQRPLGTIDLLLSDDADMAYCRPDGISVAIESATLAAVRAAALAWKARGDANPDDMLVFLFSGHGIAAGPRYALLMRDYGEVAQRPLLGAASFFDMQEGMKSCKALHQLYFIDACRVSTDILLRNNVSEAGDVVIPLQLPLTRGMRQSVYYASLADRAAYGEQGAISLFTRSLLSALRGPGAANAEGDWWINTSRLQEALTHFASELADPVYGPVQTPQSGTQTTFDFHAFAGHPQVPVYVEPSWHSGPAPPSDIARLRIEQSGASVVDWVAPGTPGCNCDWAPSRFQSWIEAGHNSIIQLESDAGQEVFRAEEHIMPPFKLFRVPR